MVPSFFIMRLRHGAVALGLTALGHPLGKTAVYDAVQAAGAKAASLYRNEVRVSTVRTLGAALGADLTSVKCKGRMADGGRHQRLSCARTITYGGRFWTTQLQVVGR